MQADDILGRERASRRAWVAWVIATGAVVFAFLYFFPGDESAPHTQSNSWGISLLGAYKDSTDKPLPLPEPRQAPTPPTERPLILDQLSKQARFDRLSRSPNPADAQTAYKMVIECRYWRRFAKEQPQGQSESEEQCGDLAPGTVDDPRFTVPLVIRAAEAGVHRAYISLFADEIKVFKHLPEKDPATIELLARVKQIALSTADPFALMEVSTEAELKGDKETALALYAASRTALHLDHPRLVVPYDPKTDAETRRKSKDMSEAASQRAIAKGLEYVTKAYRSQK